MPKFEYRNFLYNSLTRSLLFKLRDTLIEILMQILMHGINLTTLHQQVRKEALPAELGGTQAPYNNQSWARNLLGDETFSFGHQHIYWPSRSPPAHK